MPANTQKPAQPGAKPATSTTSAKPASGSKPSVVAKPASGGKK